MDWLNLLIGFVSSLVIAGLAYWKQSLNLSGFIAAVLVGTSLNYFGTYLLWIILMLFFIASTLFTKFHQKEKAQWAHLGTKGGRRDAFQVMANGLPPVLFSMFSYFSGNETFSIMAVIAIAVSNADTWASELGELTKGKTVSILTFRIIEKGQNGGVSWFGTLASLLGALYIAFFYGMISILFEHALFNAIWMTSLWIVLGGFLGGMIDSILGASVQAEYVFSGSKDAQSKVLKRGLRWMSNDLVNLLSSLLAALILFPFL
ncbi:MAG: DUF92 domain-containing protein [Candidatus Izemoplasmatales bacterium]|nr:DUF92 domain-containing protein [Candidatus Izemoplasmatales bacterium]